MAFLMQAKLPQCDSVKTFLSLWVMRTHSHAHTGGCWRLQCSDFVIHEWFLCLTDKLSLTSRSAGRLQMAHVCACVCVVSERVSRKHTTMPPVITNTHQSIPLRLSPPPCSSRNRHHLLLAVLLTRCSSTHLLTILLVILLLTLTYFA